MALKKHCEDLFGDTWMTVIGRNFGCYCIHESKNFLFFYLGECRGAAAAAASTAAPNQPRALKPSFRAPRPQATSP